MKTQKIHLLGIFLFGLFQLYSSNNDLNAQVPQGINFSGVLSQNDVPLANQSFAVEVQLLLSSDSVYIESNTISTGDLGEYAMVIGEGVPTLGEFSEVKWHEGQFKIVVNADLEGMGSMMQIACAPILSVPYAFYAERAGPAGPIGSAGTNGVDGQTGPEGNTGPQGSDASDGADGSNGSNGLDGAIGQSCWDLNGNGFPDGNEDLNSDNLVNTLDCLAGTNWKSEGGNLLLENGNLGIGTSDPQEKLHVVGNICYTGNSGSCSDKRFKKGISILPNPLEKIQELEAVYYYWKLNEYPNHGFTEDRQLGLIAQELEKIYPEFVSIDSEGYRTVDYEKLSALAVEVLKQEQTQLDILTKEHAQLSKIIEERLSTIENILSDAQTRKQ